MRKIAEKNKVLPAPFSSGYTKDERFEATKAMTPTMIESAKLLVVVNGGAIIALLAQYEGLRKVINITALKFGIFSFILALVCSCLAPFFYLMGQAHREGKLNNRGENISAKQFLFLASLAIYLAIGIFAAGAIWLVTGMT